MIWRALVTFIAYWFVRARGYKSWSNIYRWLYERRFRDVKLSTFAALKLLPPFMRNGKLWVSDTWRQLWDAVSSPQYVQQVFANVEPVPVHGFDCDEHAVFLVAAIQKSIATGTMKEPIASVRFFTVTWFEGLRICGHNSCLLEWSDRTFSFMDYHSPSRRCASVQEVADLVRSSYSEAAIPMTWCVQSLDLTPELSHWG